MHGKLITKSKVIQTQRPKSHVFRRRNKPERASTPQRWSRRIRSLPPIPISVIKTRRKNRKICTSRRQERYTSTSLLSEFKINNVYRNVNREKKKPVYVKENLSTDKSGSVEVVRIVPVVVYVKNPIKSGKKSAPEEIRVHINDNPTCRMVSQAIDTHIQKRLKQEKLNVEGGCPRRIKMPRDTQEENVGQATRKRFLSGKKLLSYH